MSAATSDIDRSQYAVDVADESYKWYKRHAELAGSAYKIAEIAAIGLSAAVPVTVALSPGNTTLIAVLGALLTIIAGLRSVYHWQSDYVRFSWAREAIRAERLLHRIGGGTYSNAKPRDELLVSSILRIEQGDMRKWAEDTAARRDSTPVAVEQSQGGGPDNMGNGR